MKLKLPGLRKFRWVLYVLLFVAALGGAVYAAFLFLPWPNVAWLRHGYVNTVAQASLASEKYAPKDIIATLDLAYGQDDAQKLDIYLPHSASKPLPTVVWIHGDAFITGDKADLAGYLKVLAGRGYAVVAVGYTLAPGAPYPQPVAEANAALAFLNAQGADHFVDPARLVLAGDSAGAQIAAQLAAIVTDRAYAREVGVAPAVDPAQLKGLILFSGLYGPPDSPVDEAFGTLLNTGLWAYLGTKDVAQSADFDQFSVDRHIGDRFPPALVSAGSADPLQSQSLRLADAIAGQGVRVDRLFFPEHYDPEPGHQYQFDLNVGAGRTAFNEMTDFLKDVTKPPVGP